MYVIVAYDADPDEQQVLRRLLSQQLNRIQNSVYAGSLRRVEADTLKKALEAAVQRARLQIWVLADEPTIHHIGTQGDQESPFV